MAAARFQRSPFAGARPKEAAREGWYSEIRAASCAGDCDEIAASMTHLVFPTGNASTLSILPLTAVGKCGGVTLPHIAGHGGPISTFQFAPFADAPLATGAEDALVKIWSLGDGSASVPHPSAVLAGHERRVETLAWHPHAANLLVSGGADATVRLWDVTTGSSVLSCAGLGDAAQSVAWSPDGALLAVTCKDKTLRVFDPRASPDAVASGACHDGVKGTRVVWTSAGTLLTTGFSKKREREVMMWSTSDLARHATRLHVDSSTGVLMPMFDPDTSLLVLAGKGDTNVRLFTVDGTTLTDCAALASREQTVGATLLPKRAVDVWVCEVARLMRLTTAGVIPMSFTVTRKSYVDFHEDLFPHTAGPVAGSSAAEWLGGASTPTAKVSMAPRGPRPTAGPVALVAPTNAKPTAAAATASAAAEPPKASASRWGAAPAPAPASATAAPGAGPTSGTADAAPPVTAAPGRWGGPSATTKAWAPASASASAPAASAASTTGDEVPDGMRKINAPKNVVRASKFRHILGTGTKAEYCYTELRVNRNFSIESNGLSASSEFVAVPWDGAGGQIAVLPLGRVGRVATGLPTVFSSSTINDIAFAPYAPRLLATSSDDAKVSLWAIPEGGLTATMATATVTLSGHAHRATTLVWAPYVENLLASASFDGSVRLWDVAAGAQIAALGGFDGEPANIAFSYDSSLVYTTAKDKNLRVHDPRASAVVATVAAHTGLKPARVISLDGAFAHQIATVGFGERSTREVRVWDARALGTPLADRKLDTSSNVAMPFFDPQTCVLFVAGRGDGVIRALELNDIEPLLHDVSPYTTSTPQNGLCMMPKSTVDATGCEFARFLKLSGDCLEPLSFTVPRARKDLFQDDVFVPAPGFAPAMTAPEWAAGACASPPLHNQCPPGMALLSETETPGAKRASRAFVPKDFVVEDSRDVKDKIVDSFEERMRGHKGADAPQERMEGAAAEEWHE